MTEIYRVRLPTLNDTKVKGELCTSSPGIGDLGSKTLVGTNNVVYQRPGLTVRDFNGSNLRLPQKREFLGPEVFNQGCVGLYGSSQFNTNDPATSVLDDKNEAHMFDYYFQSQPYFEGNHFSCSNAGVKEAGTNSALGYMKDKNGNLLWQSQNEKAIMEYCSVNY